MERPHFVLLGAGASLAALPDGDAYGRKLPLMDDLVKTLCLDTRLKAAKIDYSTLNFEALYSRLYSDPNLKNVCRDIEETIRHYFSDIELPNHPTIYDHLVLSLRPKDFIATFNWDPLLLQAIERNYIPLKKDPPNIRFLHGCVSAGFCPTCTEPQRFGRCHRMCDCGSEFEPMPLLYPVEKKDYASDSRISSAWSDTKIALKRAYWFTVFGYGAPASDREAVALLKEGWGDVDRRELEQVEIIDIKDEETLRNNWSDFIHSHHYSTPSSYFNSFLAKFPRRSCEAFWNASMQLAPERLNPAPRGGDLAALQAWHASLFEQEREYEEQNAE